MAARAPALTITNLQPSSVSIGSAGFTLVVRGMGFKPGASVHSAGSRTLTSFVSDVELRLSVAQADITQPALVPITVVNETEGSISNAFNFRVVVPRARQ